ncbi:MAG: PhnD/SsuA/transferrin family substrate-binding protein [Rhodobacteraceae bacterium]|nr:PhnD/SsuA/transferrin family substrate-binding protein [Paracoccaceae bacterium]
MPTPVKHCLRPLNQDRPLSFARIKRAASVAVAYALCGFSLALAPQPALAEIDLVFGTYAADKPTETVRKFRPYLSYLADTMSERLGEQVNISMQIASNYDDGIEDLVAGRVDFARFGPASYVTAKDRQNGIGIIAMESKKGKKTFKGIIAVHKDSQAQGLADLENGSFAFGDELSTIGRFLAQSELLDAGIAAQNLHHYAYLGRHDRVGTAVGSGEFDAGALKSSTFNKLVAKDVPIRALASFDNVTKPWLARAEINPEIFATMQRVFLETTDADILKSISKSGFLAGEDSDYAPIREAMIRSQEFGG